jgi:hypothetical protein
MLPIHARTTGPYLINDHNVDHNVRLNPFRHRIETDSARLAPSAPSTANARLQVTGSTCRLAGSLPASRQYSDRPGFDGLDRAGRGFFMTDDVAEELLVAAEVIAGFRWARV